VRLPLRSKRMDAIRPAIGAEALPWLFGLALVALGAAAAEGIVRSVFLRLPYDWRAFAASLGDTVGRRVVDVLGLSIATPVLAYSYAHRMQTIELSGPLAFAALFIGQEFFYYLYHRAAHRVRWFWANHSVHHSPNELTLAAALRLGWTGRLTGTALFFAPLMWLGFAPLAVAAVVAANLLYQFWLHAPWLPRLGPIEWVFNTPTHHKVHHACNPEYIDCNYGGVLIVFDRLFGTFRDLRPDVSPRYGLTTPLQSYNPVRIALRGWIELGRDLRAARGWRDALGIVFGPPDRGSRHPAGRIAAAGVIALALVASLSITGEVAAQTAPLTRGPAARGSAEPASLPPGVRRLADLPYGDAAKQRIDVYLPPAGTAPPGGAPILVMVHGGAWIFGDKSSRGVVGEKLAHWVARGWIFVSVNNRLMPEADPRTQAEDVARAMAFVQQQAVSWDGDNRRLVLMGHSAGAHLVALLSASPGLAAQSGANRWAGTVVLDGAALDVAALMRESHPRFYDRVFGADPAAWRAASPADQLTGDAVPMLVVCSTLRLDNSCGQAERFVARVTAVGVRASVHQEALPHNRIDVDLGQPGAYTDAVDAFIAGVVAPRN
jgi:sterol desaturase/sphingolipid hydroxylase (fatty acid hydroxylase superfamily)/acetyl esterase/lipase